ncbi:MAG: nucleoside deaminase [Candidatus Sericytochromatia bacterium]
MDKNQKAFMEQAIKVASDNVKNGIGGPFGAVIVRGNDIIATGYNTVTSSNDPTAHAEVNAIRNACKTLNTFQLDDCDIYSSCEPCPMCLSAIYWARLKNVYFAGSRYDAEDAGFDDSFIYNELAKAVDERTVKIEQILSEEGKDPFKVWAEYEQRIEY